MVKYLIIFLFFVNVTYGNDKAILKILRENFYDSIEKSELTDKLYNFIQKKYTDDVEKYPVKVLAYYGAIEAVKAKHAFNPINKASYVISGLKNLNRSIKKNKQDLEIRFLRYAVLANLPGIFNISEDRDEDLRVLILLLNKKDYTDLTKDIQTGIVKFILETEYPDSEQQEALKKLL